MTCSHLILLEKELLSFEIKETFRGKAWSKNCNEWVYFDCYLDLQSIRQRINFSTCVIDHHHLGAHDGQESGFVCTLCNDAIMGNHQQYSFDKKIIK